MAYHASSLCFDTPLKETKLLLASPTFYPFYGGAEIRFRRYLPLLSKYSIESRVITGTPKAKKITQVHKSEPWYSRAYGDQLPLENYQGIDITRYRLPEKPAKKRLNVFQQRLRERLISSHNDTDVIQFLSPFRMSIIETFKLAKKNNIATVVACTLAKGTSQNSVKNFLDSYKIKKIYSAPDCVVVSSNEIKDYLLNHGVRNRIEVIANGVDVDFYKPVKSITDKENVKKNLGVRAGRKMLLNVGTVHPRKGTDLLLRAFKVIAQENKDVDLYIAGSRVDAIDKKISGFSDELNSLLSDPILQGRVHFLGLIDNVHEYMRAADIFVFTSREEGMGNVVMEAMASGLPVVVTNYLGFPSVFGEDTKQFMLCDLEETSIAEKTLELLNSESLASNLASSALTHVRNTLALNKSVQKFADLYQELSAQVR